MSKVIDYVFTPVSPWAYLGHDRFVAIARKHGAQVQVKPADFGKIFAVSGGLPLKQRSPQRQAYRLVELKRWSEHLQRPLNLHPKHFPVSGDPAAKWILAAAEGGPDAALALTGAIMRAVWVDERDVSDAATLTALAAEAGLDAAALAGRAGSADIGTRYDQSTTTAIDHQLFGAPTYIYRDEIFWGQDRLDFLDRALAK